MVVGAVAHTLPSKDACGSLAGILMAVVRGGLEEHETAIFPGYRYDQIWSQLMHKFHVAYSDVFGTDVLCFQVHCDVTEGR